MIAKLALDTGATSTAVRPATLRLAGYDPTIALERVRVTTGSGVEFAPRLQIDGIEALGISRENLPVICLPLPPEASVDGLLGLDFFRGHRLTLDFIRGEIEVE